VVIASGLLVREADEVSAALARGLGMQETARSAEGDWAALRLTVS
jgi:ribosomal protein L11 methylase PrmA